MARAFSPRDWLLAALLVAATLAVYYPVWRGTPIWDDDAHLTQETLRSVEGLERIWFEPGATQQYYPLVHSAFWLAHRIWADNPLGYHLLNILLHAASCLLLVHILRQLAIPGAWLAAFVFALHPIEVESVAWISELKNTLSGVLYLGAMLALLDFDARRRWFSYALALILFALGLLAKSVIATLPAAMLVIVWWRRGRIEFKRDVRPLLPFFLSGFTAGLFTAWVERTYIGANGASFDFSWGERVLIAGRAFWFYLGSLLWPANLIFMYPRWEPDDRVWWQYLYPATAILLLGVSWMLRHRTRWPLAAVLLFGGTLFPVLGFLNVYPFRYSFVADHFQYLAGLTPITVCAALLWQGTQRLRIPLAATVSCVAIPAALAVLSWQHCLTFRDAETLWRTTLTKNPACWMAWHNLGLLCDGKGQSDTAAEFYAKALAIEPRQPESHINLGVTLAHNGRWSEAIAHYRAALEFKPRSAETYYNLGIAQENLGQLDEARESYLAAATLAPRFAGPLINLGTLHAKKAEYRNAISFYEEAVARDPANAPLHCNIALCESRLGREDKAIQAYETALRCDPGSIDAMGDLAFLLATTTNAALRNGPRAVELATRANEITGGRNPFIGATLAAACAETGRFAEAAATAQAALDLARAQNNTALATAIAQHLQLYRGGHPLRVEKRD